MSMKSAEQWADSIGEASDSCGGFDSERDFIPHIRQIQLDALLHAAEICANNRNYLSARDIRAEAERLRGGKQEGCQPGK